jgi:sigma-B regulation protein RsbU (phosphoserine phosphatase)
MTIPARGVGGDFFVGQAVTATRLVYALGDVSGKGVPAGLVASSLQARLEALALHGAGSAADVVADVNRTLHERSETARFATLAYLELDTSNGAMTVINAGHPPVMVVGRTGVLTIAESTGPALGVLPDASFKSETFALAPGDTVVLYSDGVTEAFDADGREFGEDALRQLLPGMIHEPAGQVCHRILDAVRHHISGTRATDDVTVLVLKRVGEA